MAIYSKFLKKNKKWREAFEQYENICGFEPMYQEAIDSGEMTPHDAWRMNIKWLEDVTADVSNISIPYDYEPYDDYEPYGYDA